MKTNHQTKFGPYDTLDEFIDTFPMRSPVLLMVENDPAVIDIDYWIDLYKRTHAQAITLAAGGYCAYYPTKIPYHYKSKFLAENQDLFGTLVERCKGIGMKYVFARTDPHAVHQDAYEAHPEWIAEDIHGNKLKHWTFPETWVTCALGAYNFEFMNEVNREIVSNYDVEFIFSNRWAGQGSGICYCENCRRMFFDTARQKLPLKADMNDPVYLCYLEWREERLFKLADLWTSEIKKIKPGGFFIPNSGGGATSGVDMVRLANSVPFLIADRQARPVDGTPWMNGKNAKEFRATMGRKPVFAGINVGICGEHRWMDSTKSQAELTLWMAEAVANGMVPRYTKHSGVVYNRRWEKPVVEFFDWLYQSEAYLRNVAPVAEVGMVISQQTGRYYGKGKGQNKVEDPINGWYQALVESRIPFEMIHEKLLDEEHLKGFKTLILPNTAALSDQQCDAIRRFIQRGGNLVATYEASLYNEMGIKRANFGLQDVFGVSLAGETMGPMRNAYLNIETNQNGTWHPLVKGLEDAGRIIHGTHRLPVTENAAFCDKPVTFVPSYPDLPMEELYPRQTRTDTAELYFRQIGASRVVYFPWDIDRIFWEQLNEDHLALLANAVEWANQGKGSVEVAGPGVMDITVWLQKNSMTVHLVNLTNPMMMRGSFRTLLPVGEQIVRVRLPQGKTLKQVKLLWNTQTPSIRQIESDLIEVVVPGIEAIEVVAFDLES